MNHVPESSTGIFAVGTLFSADDLIAQEIIEHGLEVDRRRLGWVTAHGGIEDAYRMLLNSRCGDRVVWILTSGACDTAGDFQAHLADVDWNVALLPGTTVRVDVSGKASWLKDSRFAGQLTMDAIRDQGQLIGRPRAEYSSADPGVRIAIRFGRGQVDIGITLNLTPLNQRGYRLEGGEAPLRETVAQIMLSRLNYTEPPAFVLDPCCGSGTLLIEAARRLHRTPTQALRPSSQLSRWSGFNSIDWTALVANAKSREVGSGVRFIGMDIDPAACERARANVARAGLAERIEIHCGDFRDIQPKDWNLEDSTGWILANPPYGERLARNTDLHALYHDLGAVARQFPGSELGVITLGADLLQAVHLRPEKKWELSAGRFSLSLGKFQIGQPKPSKNADETSDQVPPDSIVPLLNRISKNLKKRNKLLKNNDIDCYRIYDADLPEYNVVIDRFASHLHVQEYRPPKTVDPKVANSRRQLIREWVPKHLNIPVRQVVFKERFRQQGAQYQKQATEYVIDAHENGLTFEVNLATYTDVGLFLDHRPLRRWLMNASRGLRILNLFCYTGALSVAAAKGGAREVVSIDMSKTYLTWAHRNFDKNGLNPKHYTFVRANILKWIQQSPEPRFDIIILDPPTFSNTKSSDETLDIQRDHVELIEHACRWLLPTGTLYFSNNAQGFKLDPSVCETYRVDDVTQQSIDLDYDRAPPHVLFKIGLKAPE